MLNKRILVLIFLLAFLPLVGCLPPITENQVPIITSDPVTTAKVGIAYTYDVDATDPDGDTLTYSLTVKPTNMTINSTTGVISWLPSSAQVGDNAVTVGVSDGDLSVVQSFTIKVSKPTPTPIPTKYYTITATAGDGGSISPSGEVKVKKGSDKTLTITPDNVFYSIDVVLVDTIPVVVLDSYTFFNVTKDHTISATFKLLGPVYNQTQDTHHDTIQDAINNASWGDTILVMAGTYEGFIVDGEENLTIRSCSTVIVEGVQVVATHYGPRDAVVFVTDSVNIVLEGLTIGPNTNKTQIKDYSVIYEESSGEINNCTVSPDTVGDMLSLAIGIWDDSYVTIDSCTIEDFGRIGVFFYNGCTASVLNNTIIGQVYSGEGEVCYGIEVEADNSASQVTVTGNEIYNCDNTFSPEPLWESSGILINGWLEWQPQVDSTVIIENNDIHDNYSGIYVIKSPSSYAHFNNIYDNREYGVESVKAYDDTTVVFDAEANWWGDASGPSGMGPGTGDAVSTNVDYIPWSTSPH